jgi:V-type H+-transporting ATPase 16kDa proteolipid subunit
MGIVTGLVFANMGAAYGTAKAGVGICSVSVLKPDLMFKSLIPVIMAGILGIYGLIVGVMLYLTVNGAKTSYDAETISDPAKWSFGYYQGYNMLASGLCCGLSCLASGLCIGVVGDAGVRANAQRDIYMAIILMMIFAEALALYGFITAVVLSQAK